MNSRALPFNKLEAVLCQRPSDLLWPQLTVSESTTALPLASLSFLSNPHVCAQGLSSAQPGLAVLHTVTRHLC